jgi:hypothetical protein
MTNESAVTLESVVVSFSEQPERTLQGAEEVPLQRKPLAPDALVVLFADILEQDHRISFVQPCALGENHGQG